MIWSSKFCKSAIGIYHKGHPKFNVLNFSSRRPDAEASMYWWTFTEAARLSLRKRGKNVKLTLYLLSFHHLLSKVVAAGNNRDVIHG